MAYRLAAGTAVATNSNHLKSKCLRILYLEDSAVKINKMISNEGAHVQAMMHPEHSWKGLIN